MSFKRFRSKVVIPVLGFVLFVTGGVDAFPFLDVLLRSSSTSLYKSAESLDSRLYAKRDGHGHHHAAPVLKLNETEVTLYHAPTGPSYWSIDIASRDPSIPRYPGLIFLHAAMMCLAFFVVLPLGIALRSVRNSCRGFVVVLFYGLCALGCAASALYSKLTPNMYEGSTHQLHGYIILFFALSLSSLDLYPVIRRLILYIKSDEKFTIKKFWKFAVIGHSEDIAFGDGPEYTGLISKDSDEIEPSTSEGPHQIPLKSRHTSRPELKSLHTQVLEHHNEQTAHWANEVHLHHKHHRQNSYPQSVASERTLFAPTSPNSDDTIHDFNVLGARLRPRLSLLHRIASTALATFERALVVAGLIQLLSGIVIYTGGCRENYINGCLAHLIKGGIFWCYGLLTFARFLGSFADFGWAWNRIPSGDYPSAEFVESLVIFTYGISNTWMERFGANPGDPFTTKQMQHIGIAVMFWFAGLIGMGIESKRVRRWLASSSTAALDPSSVSEEVVAEPPSYLASFNPFPALVIGVTGAAMAAHAQTYLFQVKIHELWGNLLVGFSVMRCLTYFFLWLGPPRSILPSRPPTEALGSFFLACGGLVFIFSTEEVTIAAMRQGRDDVMMFLNVAVAVTCFAFCWTLCIVAFNGWLKSRVHAAVSYRGSA